MSVGPFDRVRSFGPFGPLGTVGPVSSVGPFELASQLDHFCQRVRPSEDRRPDEAADYRAARRCVGEKIFRNAPKCVM